MMRFRSCRFTPRRSAIYSLLLPPSPSTTPSLSSLSIKLRSSAAMATVLDSVVVPRSFPLPSSIALSQIAAPSSLYSLSAGALLPRYRGLKVGSALQTRSVGSLSYGLASGRASRRGELVVYEA
ncbi:hypothetical protein C1H46_017434 [Malus baccata]|uniref:Uncharacterized protein n=1 Tax=Malus baccata TaxID=106549 RepID=A0A540ME11_MALBA|nr:hypothetical protein C1H46_017434 [Malus baccata]